MSKFNSGLAERLHELSLHGGQDDDTGSVDELGWFGLFNREQVILEEDGQGFVTAHTFDSLPELNEAWEGVVDDYDKYWTDADDSNGGQF